MRKYPHYVLSYGGGVNSTALLFWLVENRKPLDEVIFADTGTEMPETYSYIPQIQRFCEDKNIKFTILKATVSIGRDLPKMVHVDNLLDYCKYQRIIPFRAFRSCTDKFKIQPIHRHLKNNGNVLMYIGFDYGEIRRKRDSDVKWIECSYPLIEAKLGREDCKDIIKKNGFDIPVKSGCYICPFQNYEDWIELREKHKDLFDIAVELENVARKRNPEALFWLRPLKEIDKAEREQRKLLIKEPCMGWCKT